MENFARLANSDRHLFAPRVSFRALPLLNAKPTTEVEATASCFLEREDGTLVSCYRSRFAPRAGGAYGWHHRTTGMAGCTRRRGGRVAARGAGAAGTAGDWVS